MSMYLHSVALLSLATSVFAYSIRKSRLVRILKTHSLHLIRTCKSQKRLRAFVTLSLSSTVSSNNSGGFRGGATAPPLLKSQEVQKNECIDIKTQ